MGRNKERDCNKIVCFFTHHRKPRAKHLSQNRMFKDERIIRMVVLHQFQHFIQFVTPIAYTGSNIHACSDNTANIIAR